MRDNVRQLSPKEAGERFGSFIPSPTKVVRFLNKDGSVLRKTVLNRKDRRKLLRKLRNHPAKSS